MLPTRRRCLRSNYPRTQIRRTNIADPRSPIADLSKTYQEKARLADQFQCRIIEKWHQEKSDVKAPCPLCLCGEFPMKTLIKNGRVFTAVDDYRADIFTRGETVTTRPSGLIWRRMLCWTRLRRLVTPGGIDSPDKYGAAVWRPHLETENTDGSPVWKIFLRPIISSRVQGCSRKRGRPLGRPRDLNK